MNERGEAMPNDASLTASYCSNEWQPGRVGCAHCVYHAITLTHTFADSQKNN